MASIFRRKKLFGVLSLLLLGLLFWQIGSTNVIQRLSQFSPQIVAEMTVLLFLNLFIVLFRSWRILRIFGVKLPFSVVAKANVAGYAAGLFFIPLLGQIAGRHFILGRLKVSPAVNAAQIAYERFILVITSASMAFIGIIHILGPGLIHQFVEKVPVVQVAVAVSAGSALSLCIGMGPLERRMARQLVSWKSILRLIIDAVISLLGQSVMLSAFAIGFAAVAPDVPLHNLFAAAAIISFAASLPISLGGWGVREIAAVAVMGWLGVSAATALSVSLLIGALSTLTVLISAWLMFGNPLYKSRGIPDGSRLVRQEPNAQPHAFCEIQASSTWLLGLITAVGVFYQVHVPMNGSFININLADPFAMLAFAAVLLQALKTRSLPRWREGRFNLALFLVSMILVEGFIHGWLEVGLTQWSLSGRLFGWLVLMGYLAAGYLFVEHHGNQGVRRFVETFIAVASVVVAMQIGLRILAQQGITPFGLLPSSFEGYAGNRNAFAFQLLTVLAFALGFSDLYARRRLSGAHPQAVAIGLCSLILLGTILSGSRSAMAALAAMLICAVATRVANRSLLFKSFAITFLLWLALFCVQTLMQTLGENRSKPLETAQAATAKVLMQADSQSESSLVISARNQPSLEAGAYLQTPHSSSESDQVRWQVNLRALSMWLEKPIFGAGLGVFLEKSTLWFPVPVLVHNTPLWLLAELGILGFVIFGWLFYRLLRSAWPTWGSAPTQSRDRAMLLLLVMFFVFSLAHEMLYQRILWLALGVLLAIQSPRKVMS